jgi:hypothetical protein
MGLTGFSLYSPAVVVAEAGAERGEEPRRGVEVLQRAGLSLPGVTRLVTPGSSRVSLDHLECVF